jgi:hypothetical protein
VAERTIFLLPLGEPIIEKEQLVTLDFGEMDIGIAKKRAEVIEEVAEAHALEVDKEGLLITDHHILGLKVPVHETDRCGTKAPCQRGKLLFECTAEGRFESHAAQPFDEMLLEIAPFPLIELTAERLHEANAARREPLNGENMKAVKSDKGLMIEDRPDFPGPIAQGPKIDFTEVLHKDQTGSRIVADDGGHRYMDIMQEERYFGEVGIFRALRVVSDQDARLGPVPFDTKIGPVRPPAAKRHKADFRRR